MAEKKLTKAQRRVLARMATGEDYCVHSGPKGFATFIKGGTVSMATSHALWKLGFVVGTKEAALGVTSYAITPAGRRALDEASHDR